ncbi:baseplate J protein [Ochrobactrum sp. 30A/1000/2015]|uniref:baseplate J/gp47 family protein n=1 Tax=Brucella anthropi TaxID=529 RepID=UPI0005B865D5|nr:baseplate J/gp47 family protein [Brucella anthropi]KIU68363.1 baseplate J protein [Brucella anthropi]PJT19915.1 baseplate J protein [Ochrobactrum sp. 30A/1000/2015]PJT37018.1 baseplate J protein [Ochrobactrum sp. 27A/999/2015]PJT45293.1 baseplate J protein [Ochrobactrum sp. 23A/997/2015]
MSTFDFSTLPPPEVIKTFYFEAILAERMADLRLRLADAGIDYDVGHLETDILKVVHLADSMREVTLRTAINDAAMANLLAFALGGDLDHLAHFYDVERLVGETDNALRDRTVLAIKARSPGGSEWWYAAAAKRADVRIRSVKVYREAFWPIIHIAVLSSASGGIPDQAMLDAVTAEVMSDRVRLLNDTLIVEPAVATGTDIDADIWLLPDAAFGLMDVLPEILRQAWQAEAGIGFDLEPSWIEARLHVAGVKRVHVRSPSAPVIASAGVALTPGAIKLNYMGRDY